MQLLIRAREHFYIKNLNEPLMHLNALVGEACSTVLGFLYFVTKLRQEIVTNNEMDQMRKSDEQPN